MPADIKVVLLAGVEPATALKACLGASVKQWARDVGEDPATVSAVVNGSARHPAHSIRDKLAAHLGVQRWWLDELLERIQAERGEGVVG